MEQPSQVTREPLEKPSCDAPTCKAERGSSHCHREAVRLSPRNAGALKAAMALGFKGSRRDKATGLAADPRAAHHLQEGQQRCCLKGQWEWPNIREWW